MIPRLTSVLLVGLTILSFAAAPATQPSGPQPAEQTRRIQAVLARCEAALKEDPKSVGAWQAKGENLFFLGRIDESVQAFDQVVQLSPEQMPHNWQRGIALYYAGRFADAVRQFEAHRRVNPQDVENAAWHYLCRSQAIGGPAGVAAARKELIPIDSDPRVPLMKVHQLFAGTATPDEVIAEAKKGDPSPEQLHDQLFYAHLYIALFFQAEGNLVEADQHMKLAATTFGVKGYMGDVARVDAWLAANKKKATSLPTTKPCK